MSAAAISAEEVKLVRELGDALRGAVSCDDCRWCSAPGEGWKRYCLHVNAAYVNGDKQYSCEIERRKYGITKECGPDANNFEERPAWLIA